jgi:hypothetical protein
MEGERPKGIVCGLILLLQRWGSATGIPQGRGLAKENAVLDGIELLAPDGKAFLVIGDLLFLDQHGGRGLQVLYQVCGD